MLQVLPEKEREVLIAAAEARDQGTSGLITPMMAGQEKPVWILRAWLN